MLSENERAWWVRPDDAREDEDPKAHEKLHCVIDTLLRNQDRKRDMLLWGAMYAGGVPSVQGAMGIGAYVRSAPGARRTSLSLNVTQNATDAVVSRLFSKSQPRVSVSTVGGDYEKQDAAEQLEYGIDGAQRKTEYYDKSVMKGLDGCVFGTGINRIRCNYDEQNVDVLRTMPWELLVDDGEATTNPNIIWEGPRSVYLRYYIDKYVLMHRMQCHINEKLGNWYASGDDEEVKYKLDMTSRLNGCYDNDAEFGFQNVGIQLVVEEAWHRPSGKGASDGRYVMGVGNCTLIDRPVDEYESEFSWYRWANPVVGFYGQGIVERGSPIQSEINKLLREIQHGHHMIRGRYLVEMGSKVIESHLNNDLTAIVRYAGTMPQYLAPSIIAPEVYSHLWGLYAKYYEIVGINQQTAQAQRPVGLDSGEAQRVYADQQTETLLDKGKRFERVVEKDGMLIAKAAKKLSATSVYEVRTEADDGFESIDWKKLDEPDDFQIYVETTSALPGTLAGKLSTAQDLLQLGVFKPEDILEMVGMPDVLQIEKRKNASRKLTEKKVGEMLRGFPLWIPPPQLNLAESVEIATEMVLLAERKEVAESNLDRVRQFIDYCNKQLKPPPPPMPPAPGMGAPGGLPPMPSPGGPLAPGAPMPPPGANGVMPT